MDFLPMEWVYVLLPLALVILGYAFIDHKNKFYGNIAASIMALVLFIILTLSLFNGSIKNLVDGTMVSWTNGALGLFCLFCVLLSAGYTLLEAYMVYQERSAGEST